MVHPDKRKDFDNQVALILNETNFNSFQHHCHSLMKEFSYCKNWLKWHLVPERAIIIFPACSNSLDQVQRWNRKSLTNNTNAQESVNKIIQTMAPKKKLNVQETIEHNG